MDVSEALRRAFLAVLSPLVVDGITIPVFDEMVNPLITIPTLDQSEVYVVVQDQQEMEGQQNYCNYRQNCSLTVRIVTKYDAQKSIGKKVAEKVSNIVQTKIKPTGKAHALTDANGYVFQRVNKELSRTYTEYANGITAVNKAIIYSTIVNQ